MKTVALVIALAITPRLAALIATIITVDASTATMPKATRGALASDLSWTHELRLTKQDTGYRVFGIRPDSAPARMNLQNGDTLTHLNGIKLEDEAALQRAKDEAKSATTLTIRVHRRDVDKELVVQIH